LNRVRFRAISYARNNHNAFRLRFSDCIGFSRIGNWRTKGNIYHVGVMLDSPQDGCCYGGSGAISRLFVARLDPNRQNLGSWRDAQHLAMTRDKAGHRSSMTISVGPTVSYAQIIAAGKVGARQDAPYK
jgi:hypothetical protein